MEKVNYFSKCEIQFVYIYIIVQKHLGYHNQKG